MRLRRDVKTRLITSTALFGDCTPEEVAEVAAIADEIDFRPGTTLTREDAEGNEFLVLIDGQAEVSRGGEVVAVLAGGDWFGEVALLTGGRRNATVTARTAVHALVIEGHRFRTLLQHAPDVRKKVERVLAERSS